MALRRGLAEAQRRAGHSDRSAPPVQCHGFCHMVEGVPRPLCDMSRDGCRAPMGADGLSGKHCCWLVPGGDVLTRQAPFAGRAR